MTLTKVEKIALAETKIEELKKYLDKYKKDSVNSGWFANALTIVFIILKLCHVINWSWWLVLLPTMINLSLFIFFMTLFTISINVLQNKMVDIKQSLSKEIKNM